MKRAAGRPRKPAGEKRVAVKVYLSPAESERLRRLAEAAGITLSAFIRARALSERD